MHASTQSLSLPVIRDTLIIIIIIIIICIFIERHICLQKATEALVRYRSDGLVTAIDSLWRQLRRSCWFSMSVQVCLCLLAMCRQQSIRSGIYHSTSDLLTLKVFSSFMLIFVHTLHCRSIRKRDWTMSLGSIFALNVGWASNVNRPAVQPGVTPTRVV